MGEGWVGGWCWCCAEVGEDFVDVLEREMESAYEKTEMDVYVMTLLRFFDCAADSQPFIYTLFVFRDRLFTHLLCSAQFSIAHDTLRKLIHDGIVSFTQVVQSRRF